MAEKVAKLGVSREKDFIPAIGQVLSMGQGR